MGQLSKILRNTTEGLTFRCPGCNWVHHIPLNPLPGKPRWAWNGDAEKPTFSPSINITTIRPNMTEEEWKLYEAMYSEPGGREKVLADPRFRFVCHSVITNGRITFCTDSSHALAGQNVEIPPYYKEDST